MSTISESTLVERLREVPRLNGWTTIHLASGRIFPHKLNHNHIIDVAPMTFDLATRAGRRDATRFLFILRQAKHATHIMIWAEGPTIVTVEPVCHVTDHKVAIQKTIDAGGELFASCRGAYRSPLLRHVSKEVTLPFEARTFIARNVKRRVQCPICNSHDLIVRDTHIRCWNCNRQSPLLKAK